MLDPEEFVNRFKDKSLNQYLIWLKTIGVNVSSKADAFNSIKELGQLFQVLYMDHEEIYDCLVVKEYKKLIGKSVYYFDLPNRCTGYVKDSKDILFDTGYGENYLLPRYIGTICIENTDGDKYAYFDLKKLYNGDVWNLNDVGFNYTITKNTKFLIKDIYA